MARGARDDALARTGALACLGGCYVAAATSKLLGAGPTWIDGDTLRAVALSHAHVDGAALTDWLAHSPRPRALAGATLAVQLGGGVGLLVPGRARVIAAASLVAFHLGVAAFTRIGYWQPVALLLALAGPWSRADDTAAAQQPARADRAVLLAIVIATAIAWLSPRCGATRTGTTARACSRTATRLPASPALRWGRCCAVTRSPTAGPSMRSRASRGAR
ncbi:MAG: hypothetical protein U0168_02785 [Nannocystaceae bacterium]